LEPNSKGKGVWEKRGGSTIGVTERTRKKFVVLIDLMGNEQYCSTMGVYHTRKKWETMKGITTDTVGGTIGGCISEMFPAALLSCGCNALSRSGGAKKILFESHADWGQIHFTQGGARGLR